MAPFDQSRFMKKAKSGVQAAMASPDHLLVQLVGAIDEIYKMANLASERLTEWYGLHFPEFKAADPLKYAQVALVLDRANPDAPALNSILGEGGAASVLQKAKSSVGVAFAPADLESVRAHAKLFITMQQLREQYEKYQEELATRLAPNMSHLAGAAVTAKLVAQAGGLTKLATLPASTVQVLGAEKALFKHLKSGSPPPKHGLIFQHPLISTAPKRARGKLSRALAAKLTIAAKADAFSHHFIADKLKEQFEARAKIILGAAKASPPAARTPPGASMAARAMPSRPAPGSSNRPASGPSSRPAPDHSNRPASAPANRPPFPPRK